MLVSAYAPTMTNPEDIKEKFYEDLDNLLKSIPSQDKLFVLGDFNARVGTDFQTWKGVIGMNGVGKYPSPPPLAEVVRNAYGHTPYLET